MARAFLEDFMQVDAFYDVLGNILDFYFISHWSRRYRALPNTKRKKFEKRPVTSGLVSGDPKRRTQTFPQYYPEYLRWLG